MYPRALPLAEQGTLFAVSNSSGPALQERTVGTHIIYLAKRVYQK